MSGLARVRPQPPKSSDGLSVKRRLIDALPPESSFSALQGPRLYASAPQTRLRSGRTKLLSPSIYLVLILLSNSNTIDSSISIIIILNARPRSLPTCRSSQAFPGFHTAAGIPCIATPATLVSAYDDTRHFAIRCTPPQNNSPTPLLNCFSWVSFVLR